MLAHVSKIVAQRLWPWAATHRDCVQVLTDGVKEADVVDFLKKVPVKLGQGKVTLSLNDVLPNMCVQDIVRACEDFERSA